MKPSKQHVVSEGWGGGGGGGGGRVYNILNALNLEIYSVKTHNSAMLSDFLALFLCSMHALKCFYFYQEICFYFSIKGSWVDEQEAKKMP